jgi:hypothetical protein
MGLTRRQLAAAAVMPAASQTPTSPAKPADELASAAAQRRSASDALRKVKIDAMLEPSFVFRP